MANCPTCRRSKPKCEEHLAREGFFECKATDNAPELMRAYNTFAAQRRSQIPFVVVGAPGNSDSVWPFQFKPDAIAQCAGYME